MNKELTINKEQTTQPDIIIAIPCLREQDIIEQTLRHFFEIVPENANIEFMVITTIKERFEKLQNVARIPALADDILRGSSLKTLVLKYNELLSTKTICCLIEQCAGKERADVISIIETTVDEVPSTGDVVLKLIESGKPYAERLHLIEYPDTEGVMAHQLNYALNSIIKDKFTDSRLANTYFAVYNADSLPDKTTIERIIEKIRLSDFPIALQQYSCCISNLDKLNWIMKGFSLFQSNFELKYGLVNASLPSRFLYSYVVGHGMYIRLDKLYAYGGFETDFWCEDIYLSCLLRNENIDIEPIYCLEKMETPQYLPIVIKQNAVWFRTAFECIKLYKHVVTKRRVLSVSGVLWVFQRLRMNIAWLLSPFFIIFSLLYPMYNLDINLLFLSFFLYLLMILTVYLTTIDMIEKLLKTSVPSKHLLLAYTGLIVLISNLGPVYSLFNRKGKKYKTAR